MHVQFIGCVFSPAKDHREHVKCNKQEWKSAWRSSPKRWSLWSPSFCLPWTFHASFWHYPLLFPTDGPPIFWRPRTECVLQVILWKRVRTGSWGNCRRRFFCLFAYDEHIHLHGRRSPAAQAEGKPNCGMSPRPLFRKCAKQKISGKKY